MTRPSGNDPAYMRPQRVRHVVGGNEIDPQQHPLDLGPSDGIINRTQMTYLVVLAVLLVIALILFVAFSPAVASPVLFVLALALFLGWIIF